MMTNPLVSKDGTYNSTAFDKPWWDGDIRFGFDPPEDEGAKKREKEWHRQFQRQQQQINEDWADYERESSDAEKNTPRLSSPASKGNVTKDKDPKDKETPPQKRTGGFGSMLSNAMKPSLKKLARHGIPSELRAKIWFEKSGASQKKQDNPGVYAKYIAAVSMDSSSIEEIQMDIARTFSMHLMFATSQTKTMMLRILAAFTVRNPSYGYCQNMTFIVGLILFFLPEEDAFWLFVTIIEDLLPVDFCSPTLMGLRVDQKILEVLLKERLPKLYGHFVRCNIDLSCFTTSWLLRLFVNVFPIQTTLRIWDCFLVEGSKILFRVALAFLKIHDEAVKQCNDSGELMTFLTTECRQFYDADRLIKACASFWALRRKQINELRMKFIKEELDENPQLAAQYTPGGTGVTNLSDDEANTDSPTKSDSAKTETSTSERGKENEKPNGKENERPTSGGWESDRPTNGGWENERREGDRGRSPRGDPALRGSLVIGGHSRSPSRDVSNANEGHSHSRTSSKDSNSRKSSNSSNSGISSINTSNTSDAINASNLRTSNISNDADTPHHTHHRANSQDTTDSTFPTSTFSDSTDIHTNTPNDTTTSHLTHSRTSSNDATDNTTTEDNSTTSVVGLHRSADSEEVEGGKKSGNENEKEKETGESAAASHLTHSRTNSNDATQNTTTSVTRSADAEEAEAEGNKGEAEGNKGDTESSNQSEKEEESEKKGDEESGSHSGGNEETRASESTGAKDENSKSEIGTEAENLATSTNSSIDDFVMLT